MDKANHIDITHRGESFVHNIALAMPEFNRNYGLWLFAYRESAKITPRTDPLTRYFRFYGISQAITCGGWYFSNGKKKQIKAGDCIISTPGVLQDYASENEEYMEDAICFTGQIADNFFKSGIIQDGVFPLGSGRYLLPIIELLADPSHNAQIKANMALIKLLTDIHLNTSKDFSSDRYHQVDYLIEMINLHPEKWWTSAEMSEICSLSQSQLRIVFQRKTGMKPKIYIDRIKIQRASNLLRNSNMNIADIAKSIGYADPFHFSRRFKQLTGVSPGKYRIQFSFNPTGVNSPSLGAVSYQNSL
jgi:AraC-like DNA-binding protein